MTSINIDMLNFFFFKHNFGSFQGKDTKFGIKFFDIKTISLYVWNFGYLSLILLKLKTIFKFKVLET